MYQGRQVNQNSLNARLLYSSLGRKGGDDVGWIKPIGTFEVSTKSGHREQLMQLQAHSPAQDTALGTSHFTHREFCSVIPSAASAAALPATLPTDFF